MSSTTEDIVWSQLLPYGLSACEAFGRRLLLSRWRLGLASFGHILTNFSPCRAIPGSVLPSELWGLSLLTISSDSYHGLALPYEETLVEQSMLGPGDLSNKRADCRLCGFALI